MARVASAPSRESLWGDAGVSFADVSGELLKMNGIARQKGRRSDKATAARRWVVVRVKPSFAQITGVWREHLVSELKAVWTKARLVDNTYFLTVQKDSCHPNYG